jgi:hypothetical protein
MYKNRSRLCYEGEVRAFMQLAFCMNMVMGLLIMFQAMCFVK